MVGGDSGLRYVVPTERGDKKTTTMYVLLSFGEYSIDVRRLSGQSLP